jgi:hypothetical protein
MVGTFVKRHNHRGEVPLRASDFVSQTKPKVRSYWMFGELFYEYEGIRVIFLCNQETILPRSVNLPTRAMFDDDETLINVYDWLDRNVPGVQFVIVAYGGALNPNGNTKIKTIKCAPRKPK